jgi:1,4-alpha-glucan branching enzyme
MQVQGIDGVRFAVWAPNAQRVAVVGDFNGWDGRRHPMRLRHTAGVWEPFLPGVQAGARYKFRIVGADGRVMPDKFDPMARWAEPLPPATASRVPSAGQMQWHDDAWLAARRLAGTCAPLSIYEVHAGSWQRSDDGFAAGLGCPGRPVDSVRGRSWLHPYRAVAGERASRWRFLGLSAAGDLRADGTPWHATGVRTLRGPLSPGRHGSDRGLGGALPQRCAWPGRFDGTALYEHADPREGVHADWDTLIYNYGRNEVAAYLIGSALSGWSASMSTVCAWTP